MVSIIGLAVLAGVAAAVLILLGIRQPPPPPPLGPVGNGLIAYSFDGDIYVGDPVSGATTRIVSGPKSHVNPIFSPDGSEIAFLRGAPLSGPVSLVVISVDGSVERVVMTEDFGGRGMGSFAWTPDGTGIVVEVDLPPYMGFHQGELAWFDASVRAEPRLLAPPLTTQRGAMYFNASAQVAPMFRPPDGDLILDVGHDPLTVFDATLTSSRELGGDALARYEPYWIRDPTWSPGGTMIAVILSNRQGAKSLVSIEKNDQRHGIENAPAPLTRKRPLVQVQ